MEAALQPGQTGSTQARFFELVACNRPDVIVLDFSRTPGTNIDTLRTVRRHTNIPILVVCNSEQRGVDDFRVAGAAGCIPAPLEIRRLYQAINDLMLVKNRAESALRRGASVTPNGGSARDA